tara:strand:+ start:2240 stop:2764 length:525 start_codon:yes stop_codon:yes gene_type:complete
MNTKGLSLPPWPKRRSDDGMNPRVGIKMIPLTPTLTMEEERLQKEREERLRREGLITQFMEATGADNATARRHLKQAGWDVEAAIEWMRGEQEALRQEEALNMRAATEDSLLPENLPPPVRRCRLCFPCWDRAGLQKRRKSKTKRTRRKKTKRTRRKKTKRKIKRKRKQRRTKR